MAMGIPMDQELVLRDSTMREKGASPAVEVAMPTRVGIDCRRNNPSAGGPAGPRAHARKGQASGGRRSAGTTLNASPKSQSGFSSVRTFVALVVCGAIAGAAGLRDGLRRDGRRLGGSAFLVMGCVSYCRSAGTATGRAPDGAAKAYLYLHPFRQRRGAAQSEAARAAS